MTPSYKEALAEAMRVGASKAAGHALLAQTCSLAPRIHPGISASMLYDGAVKRSVSVIELARHLPDGDWLSDLMFA
jgi:hypothetical protein